jgi:hypothetical protein
VAVTRGFGNGATRFVDGGLALPDGWLLLSQGARPADEVLLRLRADRAVPAVKSPAGPVPTPPVDAIPVAPMETLRPHGPCPTDPVTIGPIIGLDRNDRIACLGGRALTIRAWVVDPGEGYGGTCWPVTPTWLQPCVLPDWLLAVNKASTVRLDAVRSPDATGDLKGVGRWVNVTGHFDDAASATCRTAPEPAIVGMPPLGYLVYRCRAQFAVTRIETTR